MSALPLNLIARSTPDIRVAIAGMGKMGNIHRTALTQLAAGGSERYYKGGVSDLLSRLRICGLCDTRALNPADYPNVALFDAVETLLDQACPHLLIAATPTPTHKAVALAALRRKVHTLVEKPIVTAVADLEELFQEAHQSGVRLTAGHVERYNPVSVKIKSLLHSAIPLAERYVFTRIQRHDPRITDDIIIDKVIHDLDLSLYFFGSIDRIQAVQCRRQNGQVFEATLSLVHKNGIEGRIFVSWLTDEATKIRQVEIQQGGHCWKGDFAGKRLWVDSHEIHCSVPGWIEPTNNQIKDELVDFIAYCTCAEDNAGTAPLLTFDEIRESTGWLEVLKQQILHV